MHGMTTSLERPKLIYRLRPAEIEADRDAILRVCQRSSLGCTSDKYHWNYETNPVRRAWCEVAVESSTGRVVGKTALFSRRLLIDGVTFRAAVAGDFAVDPEHRSLYTAVGLQRAAARASLDDHFDVLYAFPNDTSRPIQIRAGYKVIGSLQVGVRLLDSRTCMLKRNQGGWWLCAAGAFDWAVAHVSKESRVPPSKCYLFC